MISYLLFWIKTLYLQICSSGEQTLLNYTKESHWAKPFFSSQMWTAPLPSRKLGQVAPVRHLDLIQAFKGLVQSPQPHPPAPCTCPIRGRAKSCLPPTAATTHTTPHQGPMQSTVFRS